MASDADLQLLVDALADGTISASDLRLLEERLKASPDARAFFRERMDLEASLRTLAAEKSNLTLPEFRRPRRNRIVAAAAVVASTAAVTLLAAPWNWFERPEPVTNGPVAIEPERMEPPPDVGLQPVGTIRVAESTSWGGPAVTNAGRFGPGLYALAQGVAELSFDSGTTVVLEAPCELRVVSESAARLEHGTLFVHVSDLSDGFILDTPDARIVDEGTAYAVALDGDATEVHVFDGSVYWVPQPEGDGAEDRIESGQARRYPRSRPRSADHVPFGERRFVRRVERDIRQTVGHTLLAYDSFERLAGRQPRRRSGFGWTGGWRTGSRGRRPRAESVATPDDVVFGRSRSGSRQVSLADGNGIRRELAAPIAVGQEDAVFVSFIAQRAAGDANRDHRSLQLSLEEAASTPRPNRRVVAAAGISTEGFPFVKSGPRIGETAALIADGEIILCVMRLTLDKGNAIVVSRVFHNDEVVTPDEPLVWTATSKGKDRGLHIGSVRLRAGRNASWLVDELRIGTTWQSVTQPRDDD